MEYFNWIAANLGWILAFLALVRISRLENRVESLELERDAGVRGGSQS